MRPRRTLLDEALAALVRRLRPKRENPIRLSDLQREREIRYHENELRRLRRGATEGSR